MISGFGSYWIYSTIKKIYFKKNKYDIMRQKLPRKESFLKSWNNKRRNQDGMYFFNLQKYIPKSKLEYIKLFTFYYLENPDFHVSDIFHDEFRIYKKYKIELENLKDKAKTDFLMIFELSRKENRNLKSYFISEKGFPRVFKLYEQGKISIHSLIAFDIAFIIVPKLNIENLNIVEKEKYEKFDMIFVKYYNIVSKYYNDIDWKQFLYSTLH